MDFFFLMLCILKWEMHKIIYFFQVKTLPKIFTLIVFIWPQLSTVRHVSILWYDVR